MLPIQGIMDSLLGTNKADGILSKNQEIYDKLKAPTIEEMLLNLQQYQSQGALDPAMEQALAMGPSAMEQISSDPRLRSEQMKALESMAGLASGNPSQGDRAGFELARQQSASEMQAKNNQVLQEMAQRGQSGSGAELLAKLKNNQSGAQMLQNAQMEEAKAMQAARMQALQQQASMAGNLRQQDYGEASNLAKAKDTINQFNTQNAQGVASRNTGAQNTAQQNNLQNRQNVANQNTQTMNQQQQYNKGLNQQNFNNQLSIAGGKAGVNTAAAQQANANYQNNANMVGGLINTGIGAAMMMSDEKEKKNVVESNSIQNFLDSLTAFNYDYKDESNGQGKQTSVMAQDLEKSPQGKAMVEETPQGKQVDYGKGLGTMMAAMAHINDRLNKMESK